MIILCNTIITIIIKFHIFINQRTALTLAPLLLFQLEHTRIMCLPWQQHECPPFNPQQPQQ
jgi:hypothetical protein